jgi:uncharacterized membrane protein
MKKIDWGEMLAYVIIATVIFIPAVIINYIEENYELTNCLWTFNIVVIIIAPLYYFIYSTREKRKTKKIEKNTIIQNIDFKYYRDIIEEYSPAMLSFILDGTEFDKDLGASVIYLINKGYLELQDGNKIIRTNKDSSKLSKDLQLIYNSDVNHLLAFRKLKIKNIIEEQQANIASQTVSQWMKQVEEQVVEDGLVTERKKYRMISILSILCILEAIYTAFIDFDVLHFFSWFLVFLLIFLKWWAYDKNKWVKTQKGYEIYTKIVGLKNYIKDYSMLSEKELKEIAIWDDYLIYAIIFNNTSKLNQEAMEFYKKICGTT